MTDQELHEQIIKWEDEADSLEDELENAQKHLQSLYEVQDSRRNELDDRELETF